VQLNVDRRSQKHQQLSEKRAQRQARLEAERLAEEERRKAEEEREVRELRRNLVSLSLCPHPFSAFRFGRVESLPLEAMLCGIHHRLAVL
jgi:hypothetical protein